MRRCPLIPTSLVALSCLIVALTVLVNTTDAQGTAGAIGNFATLARFEGEGFANQLAVSPNGRLVMQVSKGQLGIRDVSNGKITAIGNGIVDDLVWSPSSDRVAWVRYGDTGSSGYIWTVAVNPTTGALRGSPQRVTPGTGGAPAISVDGKWVAYLGPQEKGAAALKPLVVVPVTGGPERIIAKFGNGEELHWSADGKSIYLAASLDRDGDSYSVFKAFVDGRKPQAIRPLTEHWFAGMTHNGARLLLVPQAPRVQPGAGVIVADTNGKELSRALLPVGAITQYDGVIGDSMLVWRSITERQSLVVRSLVGGASKQVPLVGESDQFPEWSPDGRQVAFQVREGTRVSLATMNADGSNVRIHRETDVRTDPWGVRWSPDSRIIGFVSHDLHHLRLLDVTTGAVTLLLSDTTVRIGVWRWRNDARSVFAIMPSPNNSAVSTIEEVPIGGQRRTLRNLAGLPGGKVTGFQWMNDSSGIIRTDSASYLLPFGSAAPRRLADAPGKTNVFGVAVSRDGKTVATPLRVRSGGNGKVELLSLESGATRELSLPFWFLAPITPTFSPDGRSVFIAGRQTSDSLGANVYAVPLDGGAPRVVANMPSSGGGFSLAPDGRSIIHSTLSYRASALLLVDLRPSTGSPSQKQ